jgi:hypothetical protein
MSTPPTELPRAHAATQIAGQQSGPSTTVPMVGPGVALSMGRPNNTLAVVSLVAAILSFVGNIVPLVGWFTLALIAIVTGHMARRQIRETGEGGMGLATAGLVIGYIHLALIAVVVIFFFGLVMALLAGLLGAFSTGG